MIRALWAAWKKVAHAIGDVQARVLLSLFYFVLLSPFAVSLKLSADPLRLRRGERPRWLAVPAASADPLTTAGRQS